MFVAVCNSDNGDKLGNGGLYLAENISAYLVGTCGYSQDRIVILFDDGNYRADNGNGDVIGKSPYEAATKSNALKYTDAAVGEASKYADSQVFLWYFDHGSSDIGSQESYIWMWDGESISSIELGEHVKPLNDNNVESVIIVDACQTGFFADQMIGPFAPETESGVPGENRVVMTGASALTFGWSYSDSGPIFSLSWFEGIKGVADGQIKKDGKVSVEEAFWYASGKVNGNTQEAQPQMNDQYEDEMFL
ncbi:MAG: caspase family protein [Candidatus Thermoplasmatota archaeon]|nr:caspase family protein [Candidatus Thermoplasmatota archaeon]